MFGNYLIGLREGLEASLVVCILVAYLVKSERRDALRPVWLGVSAAVLLAMGFGAVLQYGSRTMTFEAQEMLGGSLSVIAVGLVTWMVFWMRRTARHLKKELHGKLDAALAMGTGALVLTAFLAVGREGLETALFIWTAVQATNDGVRPLVGALLGLLTAVVLGWLFYRGALKINLAKFFTWTGGMLIVVAAGVLAYGFHDLQEADVLPGLHSKAFDISEQVPVDSWYGTLLKGVFNFQPDPTWLQVAVWALYLVPTLLFFFAPGRAGKGRPGKVAPSRAPQEAKADATSTSADAVAAAPAAAVAGDGGVRDGARRTGDHPVGEQG
ncbi:FTR1 family protein [Streptomyces sp. AV19]|uniref:iron uptake transporter permease EfeU n=1 Tax=Streptomyces sp. AV19 TaxID=2793068 RepID=UPI0018FE3E43|nr:iron uptake transporter permease EfeU [Streptomyces sp. AV19]MBH1933434.1 FTR1 family protein [Streptomyces sp. AV19]MDG4532083.1 FTR1 family protein [Streptomyces sp. AV19]